jgi:hypothetical protein
MSPELKRNFWLELTPSRVVLMTSVLGLLAIAVFLLFGRRLAPLAPVGVVGFAFITVFWGSRNAARSVIGEIRERTWDFQRLSAMTPASMTLGKLFGATSYTWYGGILALLIAASGLVRMTDGAASGTIIALLLASGLLAHATALGSALATARRRRADARLSVLPHQTVGIIAPIAVVVTVFKFTNGSGGVHSAGSPLTWLESVLDQLRTVHWYGGVYNTLELATLAVLVFAVWAMLGAWREMRLELMETNAPVFWPLFLLFLALFLFGFSRTTGEGIALAYIGVMAAAWISLVAEPKNAVELRALGSAVAHARLGRVLISLPAYGWAFIAATALAITLTAYAPATVRGGLVTAGAPLAWLGFLARDIGVFHVFHAKPRQQRGDFAGLVSLALLYVVGSMLADRAGDPVVSALVSPRSEAPTWTFILPWLEAAVVWVLAIARYRGARSEGAGHPARA